MKFLRGMCWSVRTEGLLCTSGTSMGWLSRAAPAGRPTPRRTTALRESSRRGRAQRAPARSTPGVATSLVTDAWRKGGCGARDLRPTLHQPGPRRAGRWHCAVTVPGRWGGCAAAVRPRLPGGDVTSSSARPRDRAFASRILFTAPGRIGRWQPERRRRAVSIGTLCGRPPMCSAQGYCAGPA